ncbi:M28 family peptidase [Planctomicrobium piriforme]|uniref:PA domain-containing protein n=1 Tax=Planctomicrobium piriforme TaxID=1576369 RepID=A0A1I3LBM9_9PLAN|nr:M28 family peptidase [Planctomicrobium piriforme]SFI81896.1 PA domain-containing protein [Planctomicrobium piriforme]
MAVKMHRTLPLGLAAIVLLSAAVLQAEELSPAAARMLQDVKLLASDEYEGRGIGTQGLTKAAEYISEQFKLAGLNVTAENGDAFQEFDVNDGSRLGEVNTLVLNGPDGKVLNLKMDQDFRTCAFGNSGVFNAPVVFLGYGIEADDIGYNDFKDMDVQGKVVIIMRRTPLQSDPHGPFAVGHGISRHAALTTKLSQAFSHGAAAVLFVNDPANGRNEKQELSEQVTKAEQQLEDVASKLVAPGADSQKLLNELSHALEHLKQVRGIHGEHNADPLMPFGYGGTRTGQSIPCFQITQKVADEILLSATGNDLAELETQIDQSRKPLSKLLNGWTATGETSVNIVKVPVKNVIGVLEGSGPLKEETIVIGAHFDHLGYGGEGSLLPGAKEIHNGADDNASGTAGLLELARRLGQRKEPLPRRLVFIAFTGEERGLLGSEWYTDAPLFSLANTVAMFNMDMIGRMEDDKLVVFGTGTSERWNGVVDEFAAKSNLKISKKPEGFGPSDQSSFYAQKIPVLHLFTGTHSDYHRPSDDWDKINAPGMARIVDMLEGIVRATADANARPDYINIPGTASLERTGNRPYFGSIPDFGKEAAGYAIQGVAPDSPADKGGLKGGDVIVRIGDRKVGGLDDFDLALRKFLPGQQIDVTVLRDGQEQTFKVTLSTPRG